MSYQDAYSAINDDNDSRWAFGTGFEQPVSTVDAPIPSGVDGADLAAYCLMLGEDALILSHRLQEWCTNGPELEDEVAIANIGLDLLGQARLLFGRAGQADGSGRDEDFYAFFRGPDEFRNVALVELPRGDFGELIARLLVFATWRLALFSRLTNSADPVLAAVAAKGVKEVAYHRDYAAGWAIRLGDGTDYSHERMRAGLDSIWPYVPELFVPHEIEVRLATADVALNPETVRTEFDDVLAQVFGAATLALPVRAAAQESGRVGRHTAALPPLLAEMQSVAREHEGAQW